MARSVTISRAALLVPNQTQLTTTKNIAAVWSVVGCIELSRSVVELWLMLFFVDSSCSAPRHQNGHGRASARRRPSTSSTPMMGACRNMIAAPARSRIFTFQ